MWVLRQVQEYNKGILSLLFIIIIIKYHLWVEPCIYIEYFIAVLNTPYIMPYIIDFYIIALHLLPFELFRLIYSDIFFVII